MGIVKSRQFWFGIVVGVAGYYIYLNHVKGKGKGFGQ